MITLGLIPHQMLWCGFAVLISSFQFRLLIWRLELTVQWSKFPS